MQVFKAMRHADAAFIVLAKDLRTGKYSVEEQATLTIDRNLRKS